MARSFSTRRIASATGVALAGVVMGSAPAWSADAGGVPVLDHACHVVSHGERLAGGALMTASPAGPNGLRPTSAGAAKATQQKCGDAKIDAGYSL